MKLFKLIKTIDYVTYPSYRELVKISTVVGNSFSTFKDILAAAIVGMLFETTPLSDHMMGQIRAKNPTGVFADIIHYEDAPVLLSIIISLLVYGVIRLGHLVYKRWGSNKNTKTKRDRIVYEFHSVAISQLIGVKSILEQVQENASMDERKKLLLLMQAKYEMSDLHSLLTNLKIIERDKMGVQTDDSSCLTDRISRCTYVAFIEEMLDILLEIYNELCSGYRHRAEEDILDIRTIINSSCVFDKVSELSSYLEDVRSKVKPASAPYSNAYKN